MAYTPVQYYLTDKLDNSEVDKKDKQIYGEIHTANW